MKTLPLVIFFVSIFIATSVAQPLAPSLRETRLGLDEVIAITMQRNLAVAADAFTPEIAYDQTREPWGVFDPVAALGFSYMEQDIPEEPGRRFTFNVPFSLDQRSMTGAVSTGVEGMLTPGTRYAIEWNNSRYDTNFFSYFPDSSLELYSSDLRLELSQPLLRGRGAMINTIRIQQAERRAEESYYAWAERVTDVALAAEGAYWTLVYADRSIEIARESLDLAEDLRRITEAGLDAGTSARVELLESEAEVSLRRQLLINAKNERDDAEDALKRLMNWFEGDYLDHVHIIPGSSPELPERPLDEGESYRAALALRGSVFAARERVFSASLEQIFARNQLLPDLSIVASIDYRGIAQHGGEGVVAPGNTLASYRDRNITDAWDMLSDGKYYDWSIGLLFTYPLGNRTARVRRDIADKQRRQAQLALDDERQAVHAAIREEIRQVQTDRERIDAARAEVEARAERLRISRKSFEVGLATSHDVLEIQEDLQIAEVQELRARIDALLSYARLSRVEGTYLKHHDIELERPYRELPLTGIGEYEFHRPGLLAPAWTYPFDN